MAMDVYAPCPCGSGKKLKFCCQNIAEDMDRISRLIENNQSRQALQQLEALDRKSPGHAWVITTQAVVLLETGETLEARNRLRQFIDKHPEHEFAAVLYAAATFQHDGLDAARAAISRAFQKGAKKHPSMLSGIAAAMSAVFRGRGRILASREHLALSLRFAPEEQRQEIFVRMLEFDSDASVVYPLRSAHPLPAITGEDDVVAEVRKAHKYAAVGCWNTAAEIFEKLSEKMPDAAEPWHAAGLCHAWFGDDAAAAAALHRAAATYRDPSAAVECETLAQVLDWSSATDRISRSELPGEITSVGRLLTALDATPRLQRLELPPQDPNAPPQPTAIYQVLSFNRDEFPPLGELSVDRLAKVLGEVIIFDAGQQEKEPPSIDLVGQEGPAFHEACDIVRSACGELVVWKPSEPTGEFTPREVAILSSQRAYPAKCPVALRRRLEHERMQSVVDGEWKATPQPALQGRTPAEAATTPEMRVKLLSAIYVLDAVTLRAGFELDMPALMGSLSLEPLPAIAVTPETPLNSLSPLQWLRLPLAELSDAQLTAVVNRAQLVHHDRFLYETLKVILQRPECLTELDQPRIYQTLADLCRVHNRRDEALHWIEEGRRHAEAGAQHFEKVWSWDLRELLMRLEDPADPGLKALGRKFVQYYSPKLPQMRPYLEQMFAIAGIPSPWLDVSLITEASVTGTAGGLWTPGAAEPAAAGSKLWIPT